MSWAWQPYKPSVSGAETTDAATVYVDIQGSSVELREIVDSATAYVDVQPSSIELREVSDAATVYVDVQPSGIETIGLAAVRYPYIGGGYYPV
jgi:hypothetical protein